MENGISSPEGNMATSLKSKTFRNSKTAGRRNAKSGAAAAAKIVSSAACLIDDDEWTAGMARMRELMGKAFAGVDVDEYVNSFRR